MQPSKKAGASRPFGICLLKAKISTSRSQGRPSGSDADGDEIDVLTSAIVAEGDADWRDEAFYVRSCMNARPILVLNV
jgi:hypothetical protein